MPRKLFQLGYNFFFQEQCLDGVTRDRLHILLNELKTIENPLDHTQILTTCEIHTRVVLKIRDSEKLLAIIIHRSDDEVVEYRNTIELVTIIDPIELSE